MCLAARMRKVPPDHGLVFEWVTCFYCCCYCFFFFCFFTKNINFHFRCGARPRNQNKKRRLGMIVTSFQDFKPRGKQISPVSCFWTRGFVPQWKWNSTIWVHQNEGKKTRYRIFVSLCLSVYCGDFTEQIRKPVMYSLKKNISKYHWLQRSEKLRRVEVILTHSP